MLTSEAFCTPAEVRPDDAAKILIDLAPATRTW